MSIRPTGCHFNVKRVVSPENEKSIAADEGLKEVPKFN